MTISLFAVLNFCNVISCISLSVIAPFFPPYAYKLGISSEIIGLIFAGQPLGAFVGSLIVGSMLTKQNRMTFMEYGMMIQGCCVLQFVSAYFIGGYYSVIAITLLARVCNGLAYSMFLTAFYAIIPSMCSEEVEQKIAQAETAQSLGFILGPLIGSLLYYIGGFNFPFILFCILSICGGVYIKLQTPTDIVEEVELVQVEEQITQQVSYWGGIQHYGVLINTCIALTVNMALTYNYPVLAEYLIDNFDINKDSVGIFMTFNALAYSISSYLMSFIKNPQKPKLIFIGLTIAGFGQFFYGPDSEFTGLSPNLIIYTIAMSIAGFSIAYPLIYSLPQLNECLYQIYPENKEDCNNIGSGLFSAAISLGEFIGPLLSGYLGATYEFDRISSIIGIILLIVCILYIPFVIKSKKR